LACQLPERGPLFHNAWISPSQSSLPTTAIHTLSLHDALPISSNTRFAPRPSTTSAATDASRLRSAGSPSSRTNASVAPWSDCSRSEEHTSELQSREKLVCRLLLEKKKWRSQEKCRAWTG